MTERQNIALRLVLLILIGSLISFVPISNSVTEKTRKVQFAYSAGAYQDQANLLLEIVDENPWWISLWESAGDSAYLSQNYSLAKRSYEAVLERNELSDNGKIRLGEVYLLLGDDLSADTIWKDLGKSPAALRSLAELYEEQGNLEAAVETWRTYLIESEEGSTQENLYHFGLLSAAYQPEGALSNLDQVAEDFPDAVPVLIAIRESMTEEPAYQYTATGQALASIGEWRLAGFAFEKASVLRPDYLEAWAYWGEALQHVEDPVIEPLEALDKAQNLDENSDLANMFLGLYWQRKGSQNKALEYFAKVEDIWPDNPDVFIEQGRSQAALGDLELAAEKFQGAIDLNPQKGLYYSQLAEFCVNYSYQVKELGLPAARLAVQFDNQDPIFLDVMGQVLLELDDELNAQVFFQRAIEIDPEYAPAYFHLGILYATREDGERTVYYLQQALNHSNNLALINQVERLLSNYLP